MDHIFAIFAALLILSTVISIAFVTRPTAPWRHAKHYTASDYEAFRQTRMGAKDTYNFDEE